MIHRYLCATLILTAAVVTALGAPAAAQTPSSGSATGSSDLLNSVTCLILKPTWPYANCP